MIGTLCMHFVLLYYAYVFFIYIPIILPLRLIRDWKDQSENERILKEDWEKISEGDMWTVPTYRRKWTGTIPPPFIPQFIGISIRPSCDTRLPTLGDGVG